MYAIDKFYTDAVKTVHKAADGAAAVQGLKTLFLSFTKNFGEAGTDLFDYWQSQYGDTPEQHIPWLADTLYLLAADEQAFKQNPPCFTPGDWNELQSIISMNAGIIDINELTAIMQLIMQFHDI